ncbi:RNA polymerase sigma factor [bacterium]|nr:RNA polymerase sigma factor [bacterium]
MPTSPLTDFIRHLGGAPPAGADLTDDELLAGVVDRRDPAALEALVYRHAPMVWGVCRRVLRDDHDAADAFQATFLVLVRRAATVRTTAGNWLYGVARQTALKARATRAKRAARERSVPDLPDVPAPGRGADADLGLVLDRELSRLPEKYRTVLVLCDLESRSGREAARELGCPEGTVASRLSRARALLARRLTRCGYGAAAGAVAWSAGVPAGVMSSTIRIAAGRGAVSPAVAALTTGVVRAMSRSTLKTALVALTAAVCAGAGGWADRTRAAGQPPAAAPQVVPAEPAAARKAVVPERSFAEGVLDVNGGNPEGMMFAEQATTKVDAEAPRSFNLIVTSARNAKGEREDVIVRRGTMRVFRADTGVDDFTAKGGWYWRCGATEGRTEFKHPGALIMVVYEHDGTVRWYSLAPDLRC